jgi:hypothetical protein
MARGFFVVIYLTQDQPDFQKSGQSSNPKNHGSDDLQTKAISYP